MNLFPSLRMCLHDLQAMKYKMRVRRNVRGGERECDKVDVEEEECEGEKAKVLPLRV